MSRKSERVTRLSSLANHERTIISMRVAFSTRRPRNASCESTSALCCWCCERRTFASGSLGMKSGGNSKLPPGVFGAGVRGSGKTASSVSVGSGGKGMVASEEKEARASEALLAVKLQSDLF